MPGTYSGEVVPIRVKIGLRPNGHADHPDWTTLPLAQKAPHEQHISGGWIYDKSSGHQDHSEDSPKGSQIGFLLVSETFADQAVERFPGVVEIVDTEEEFEEFYEARCTAYIDQYEIDGEALRALQAEKDLLESVGQSTDGVDKQIKKALDPDNPARGRKRNKLKKWQDAKAQSGITLSKRVTPK